MPSNHPYGRKFYVTQDENERMRSQRRSNSTKPVKMPNLPASLHRTVSNPFETKQGILRVPIIRREHSARPSRSILKVVDERKTSVTTPTGRAHSSDRILEHRKTPLDEEKLMTDDDASKIDEIKRSSSAEILQTSSNNSIRRAVPTAMIDYGTATSTDQTYSQSNASKLTSYFLQMKPSNSIIETGVFGEDRIYTVIGSTNRRSNPSCSDGSSSISTRSTSNSSSSNNEFHSRDVNSGSFSDESSTSLLMLVQRRNNEIQRQRRRNDRSNSPIHSKDNWLESSTRSQFTDCSYEKKRVRFADMEGFTLETIPTKTLQRTPMTNNLLTKRKQNQLVNSIRGQTTRPVFNTFYQAIAGVGGGYQRRSKLVTDV